MRCLSSAVVNGLFLPSPSDAVAPSLAANAMKVLGLLASTPTRPRPSERDAMVRFNIRFYIIAITFLMFDVDVVFIFPWATAFRLLVFGEEGVQYTPIGPAALGEMFIFLAILMIGWAYAYRKGALEWV